MYAAVVLAYATDGFSRRRWPLALAGLLFLVCAWTQSRIAWVAIPVVLGVIAAARSRRLLVTLLGLFTVVAAVSYQTDSGFQERVDRTLFSRTDARYDLGNRTRLWQAQHLYFGGVHAIAPPTRFAADPRRSGHGCVVLAP